MEICGKYGILPGSCTIPESKVQRSGGLSVSSGVFSTVWKGVYGEKGEAVAIKVLQRRETTDVQVMDKFL